MDKLDRKLEARINLYYDLRSGTTSPAPLLIALHGYGANKRQMMREAQFMAPENFAIAVFAFGGFLFSTFAMLRIFELAQVRAGPLLTAIAVLGLGFCQSVPFLLNRAAVYAIFGFLMVIFCFWGVNFLLSGLHAYA